MSNAMIQRSQRPLTGPFWAAVDLGDLVRPYCGACDASFFSPQLLCPTCLSNGWTYEASSGRGSIVSYTTIHRAPDERFTPPYVVADVEVDEGWRLFTWIVDVEADQIAIGMRVAVRFMPGVDGEHVPVFAPEAPT